MKEVGFDLILPPENDRARLPENMRRLDLAADFGMKTLVADAEFGALENLDLASPEAQSIVRRITDRYREHPGLFGYYFGDEPRADDVAKLEAWHAAFAAHDSLHPGWNNLLGRLAFRTRDRWLSYTRDYRDRIAPAVLCNDQYDFLRTGDRGQFVENAAGLCELARAAGIPAWGIVQLVEHGDYRAITAGELKWQVATWLAYGASGIGYFTYWTPAPDPKWRFEPAVIARDGSRTRWFAVLAELNAFVRAAGERLATLDWQSTTHSGSAPRGARPFESDDLIARVEGRAAIGRFADAQGLPYLMVANSDSAAARTITLELAAPRRWRTLDEAHASWVDAPMASGRRIALVLGAGSFAILRFEAPGTGGD